MNTPTKKLQKMSNNQAQSAALTISKNKVMQEFAKLLNINPMQLIGHSKNSKISAIRQLYCKLRYENHGLSYTEIGREIGRSHTAVRYSVMRINDLLYLKEKSITAMWNRVKDITGFYL